MLKRKSLMLPALIFIIAAMLLSSCGRIEVAKNAGNEIESSARSGETAKPSTTPELQKPDAAPGSDEPAATPEARAAEINNNISAFTNLSYKISEEVYEQGGIKVRYPQISTLADPGIQSKINELIKNDAMKYVQDFSSEGAALDVSFQIAWAGDNLLSIKFFAYSNLPGAAHPNNSFYSTNIYIPMGSKIKLADAVKISDYFAQAFVKNSKYVAPFESGDEKLDNSLEGYIGSIDGALLQNADSEDIGNECFSYFTADSIGIGIGVPFAIGGYALYEAKYEDIISYIYSKNEIWKDFPNVFANKPDAGNETVTSNIYELIPEGWLVLESPGGEKALGQGDFDKDGNTDLAFVIEGPPKEGQAAPRTLMVAFGNGDWTYTPSLEAKNAILRSDEGGIWGDPFEGIEIKNNCIYIHFYGGSSWRWDNTYQFRFQNGDFYLIGATESFSNINTNEGTLKDYNLLTGDYVIKETAADGTSTETKGNYDKRDKYKLSDFDPRDAAVFEF